MRGANTYPTDILETKTMHEEINATMRYGIIATALFLGIALCGYCFIIATI